MEVVDAKKGLAQPVELQPGCLVEGRDWILLCLGFDSFLSARILPWFRFDTLVGHSINYSPSHRDSHFDV